jgi:uncharacterized membrane protein YeaQ/YmgE (transglycosylase-associated protein family)
MYAVAQNLKPATTDNRCDDRTIGEPARDPRQRGKETSMNVIVWLVVGGLIGWLASLFMGTDARQGILLNVVVGIVGAVLGGWLLGGLVGAGSINQGDFSMPGLLVSFLGAVILLILVRFVRSGALR